MAKDPKDPKDPKAPDAPETKAPNAPVTDNSEQNTATEKKASQRLKNEGSTKQTIKVLHVVAKREGFRRAGFAFGSERTRLVKDDLTDEQIKQLLEEPMLVVTESTEEV